MAPSGSAEGATQEEDADAPDDDCLCLCAVELAHAGDDGAVGAPAVDAVGLEGAGGDGEACEGGGERAGEAETGEAECAAPLCVEDAGYVRGGGVSAALDVVQHHGGALARHGRWTTHTDIRNQRLEEGRQAAGADSQRALPRIRHSPPPRASRLDISQDAAGTLPTHNTPPMPPPASSTDNQGADFPDLPPAPPSHVIGQGYSAHNPVPTVQSYKITQQKHEEEAHAYAEMVERRAREAEERERRARESRSGIGGDGHAAPQSGSPDAHGARAPVKAGPDEETNAAKVQEGKKTDEPNAASGANEKARMMEQMNANQRELSGHL